MRQKAFAFHFFVHTSIWQAQMSKLEAVQEEVLDFKLKPDRSSPIKSN